MALLLLLLDAALFVYAKPFPVACGLDSRALPSGCIVAGPYSFKVGQVGTQNGSD